MKYRTNTALQALLVIADLALIWVALFSSSYLREALPWGVHLNYIEPFLSEWVLYLAAAGAWLLVTLAAGTYRAARNRMAYQELGDVLKAVVMSTILLSGFLYLSTRDVSRLRFWCYILLVISLLLIFRMMIRTGFRLIYHRSWGSAMIAPSRVVVVGEGPILYDTLCTLSTCDPKEVALLGYIDYQADIATAIDEAVDHPGSAAAAARQDVTRRDTYTMIRPLETSANRVINLPVNGNGHMNGNGNGNGSSNGHGNGKQAAAALAVVEPVHTAASARAAARISGTLVGLKAAAEPAPTPIAGGKAPDRGSRHAGTVGAGFRPTPTPLGVAIEKLVANNRADNVVVAMSRQHHQLLSRVVAELQRLPVHIVLVPDVADLTILDVGVTELGKSPALKLRAPILTDMQLVLKRMLDLVIVGGMLPFLLPLLALIATAIKIDSPGPIVFRQKRVGQYGKEFTIFKFRTMVQDAEARLREVVTYTEDGRPLFKSEGIDPRITRVGRILRRLSLDELPQLFNVLLGHMSLVGPRPELPTYVGYYDTWQHFRLWVPPGITGWWQVKGRQKQPMYLNWDDDLYYIRHYSLLLDLQILWMTLSSAVFGSTGR